MLAASTQLGPYRILSPLGAGGMGEVYRARDTRLGRDVAVKVIPASLALEPECVRRFEQEAHAAAALSHPNVCAILDVGTYEGAPYVVMELLEGESLRERLARGPLPARKAIEYAAQAAHGLAAAHEKGIIHRDLKPANLFITKDGRVKVLDFGLAKLTRSLEDGGSRIDTISSSGTETGGVLGTVGYMSPEQVLGKPTDARSDLFALGVTLYEMVTGRRAFAGATNVDTLHAILHDDPAPLTGSGRDVPPALEPIVRRCLEKSPGERFQDASDLAFDLEAMSGNAATSVGPPTPGARRWPSLATVLTLATAVLLVTTAVLYLQLRHRRDPAQVRFTRLTVGRMFTDYARFSGDEKTILFSAMVEGRASDIFEIRPGFLTPRAFALPGARLMSVSRSGELAIAMNPDSGADPRLLATISITGGTPRPILDGVMSADWAPDGRTIAITREVDGIWRLEMPPGHVLYRAGGVLTRPRVSAEGRGVSVIESPIGSGKSSVVVIDTAGHVIARSSAHRFIHGLAWSPDGTEVWFGASHDQSTSDLLAMSMRGLVRHVHRFVGIAMLMDVSRDGRVIIQRGTLHSTLRGKGPDDAEEHDLGWFEFPRVGEISADGRMLLFFELGTFAGERGAACVRRMDGGPPVRLGEGSGSGSFSPDGKFVAVRSAGPPQHLTIIPLGTGDTLSVPSGRIQQFASVNWFPDGKTLVFTGADSTRILRTYRMQLPDGMPTPITRPGVAGTLLSSDGKRLAALDRDLTLYIVPLQGGPMVAVTKLRRGESRIRWASDDASIFTALPSGPFGQNLTIFRIAIATGQRTKWREFRVQDPAGVRMQGAVMTADGRSYAYSFNRNLGDLYLVEGLR